MQMKPNDSELQHHNSRGWSQKLNMTMWKQYNIESVCYSNSEREKAMSCESLWWKCYI